MSNSNKYFIVNLNVDSIKEKDDISTQAIEEFKADGVEEYSLEEANVDNILGERAYSGGDVPETVIDEVNEESTDYDSRLKVFFYGENYEERARKYFEFIKNDPRYSNATCEELEWEDWNEKWREHYSRIEVSSNLSVVPSWELSEIKDSEIYIYPGQGFGTGGHETTFLCLKEFEEHLDEFQNKDHCLDLGCGSGILGIAAIKKKSMYVDFCDVDRAALENTLQNLELNFPAGSLDGSSLVLRDRFTLQKKYKLVFANILEYVLLEEKDLIIKSIDKNGLLILSGILNHQVENIVDNYIELEKVSVSSKGDWSCVVFKNKG